MQNRSDWPALYDKGMVMSRRNFVKNPLTNATKGGKWHLIIFLSLKVIFSYDDIKD